MRRHAGLVFSPDGKKLASAEWLWNAATPARVLTLEAAVPRLQLIFSPDSRFLATWSWWLRSAASPGAMRAVLRVFDASSGKLLQRLDLEEAAALRQLQLGLSSPAWLPQSSVLLLPVLGDAGAVRLLNVVDGKQARVALRADGSLGLPTGFFQAVSWR
jgi:WD40 repeat protein